MSLYLGDTPIAGNPYDCASTDLNNLTLTGANIANWSSNVTNCITKIPQDIKLELNSGTLTLKAGSKVYVPNGFESDGTTPKFDVVTIANDLSVTRNINSKELYVYNINENSFSMWQDVYSGSSAPSGQTWMLWYDTSSNKVKATSDGGSTWNDGFSLPVCSATSNSTQIISIDKIFNGFGYIGSTAFALPGVKGLAPNGRNIDGSLKSTAFTVSKVLTLTSPSNITSAFWYRIALNGSSMWRLTSSNTYYDEEHNGYWNGSANAYQYNFICPIKCNITSGVVSNFSVNSIFHALDWNDKEIIVSWGMPNYGAAVSKSLANGSISGKGYLLFTTKQNVGTCNITIGSTVFAIGGNYNTLDTLFVPVDNNSYACSDWSIINTLKYIPLKGV